jgi:TonB family protein
MLMWRVSVLFAFLSTQAAFAAPPRPPLPPIGPWVLNYGETQCVASREYGTEKDPLTFGIRPAPNGETYELLVGRARYGPEFAEEFEGSVDFGNGPISAWLLHYGGKGKKISLDQFRIASADMAQASASKSVTLHTKGGPNVCVELANMPALLKGLADCTADLKHYWNMEPPEKDKIATPSKGDLRSIFRSTDYPADAMKNRQEGRVQFLLLVDERGKIASCHVLQASGVPVLDGMGCQVLTQRAKFTPSLDQHGKPIRSSVVTPVIVWRIGS